MKPTRDTFTVQSTVGDTAEAVAMTIDPGAMQHIMGILTDLYADPETAVLREYATNARDAHIAARNPAPIRVELPTDLRPMLTITDEGVGLDADDIRAIYSQYGASTKRDSDEATGMLGLGCKSALAYADQFTLIGRKAGRQVTVAVSRDESGAGVMNLLDERPTDAPNGVDVQIPARRHNELAVKARELFRFWPEGSVLVNGEPPARIEGYELSPELIVVDKTELGGERAMIVMGGVPYPAPNLLNDDSTKLAYHKALVAWVDIGAVHFAPSREALMDTPTTRRTIEAIRERFTTAKAAALQRDVDAATTRGEALAAQVAAQDALAIDARATWRGAEVPDTIDGDSSRRWWYLSDTRRYYRASRSHNERVHKLATKVAARAVWVTEFTNGTWTSAMRAKLDRYCGPDGPASDGRGEEGETEYVLTHETALASPWLEECRTIRWPDVREWRDPNKPPASGGGAGTYAGTYGTWAGGWRHRYPAADLATDDGPVFWMEGEASAYEPDGGAAHTTLERHFGEDVRLVVLPKPRVAKFCRTFPEARPVEEGLREAAAAWDASLTPLQRRALATFAAGTSYYYRNTDSKIHMRVAAEAHDPALRAWNRVLGVWTQELHQGKLAHARYLPPQTAEPVPNPLTRYPLLENASGQRGTVVEHMILYVNAVYAKENE